MKHTRSKTRNVPITGVNYKTDKRADERTNGSNKQRYLKITTLFFLRPCWPFGFAEQTPPRDTTICGGCGNTIMVFVQKLADKNSRIGRPNIFRDERVLCKQKMYGAPPRSPPEGLRPHKKCSRPTIGRKNTDPFQGSVSNPFRVWGALRVTLYGPAAEINAKLKTSISIECGRRAKGLPRHKYSFTPYFLVPSLPGYSFECSKRCVRRAGHVFYFGNWISFST